MDELIPNSENKKPDSNLPEKVTYDSPKAEFVPLKIEERLMICGWKEGDHCAPLKSS